MTAGLDHPSARSLAADRSRAWQHRRAELLHEACLYMAALIAAGEPFSKVAKQTARKFRNGSLGNGRQLALSPKTMQRVWYDYRDRGEAAFVLNYIAPLQHDLDPLLLRLIVQASVRQSKSVSEILTDAGVGQRTGRASLRTLHRALPTSEIARFVRAEKRLLASRKSAEAKLAKIQEQLRALKAKAERTLLTGRRD